MKARHRIAAALLALGLHAQAAPQPVDKDPLDYSLRQYGIVLIFALLGGLVSWVSKVRAGTVRGFQMLHLVGELATSALAGLLMFYFCEWVGLPKLLSSPRQDEIELLQSLDRWVRGMTATMATGKSITDALRLSARNCCARPRRAARRSTRTCRHFPSSARCRRGGGDLAADRREAQPRRQSLESSASRSRRRPRSRAPPARSSIERAKPFRWCSG